MGAIASIVVPDAATTPVNHTFAPMKIDGNTARWAEKSSTTPQGWWLLDSTLRQPVAGSKTFRTTINLSIPKLKTFTDLSGNSVTTVDYVHRAQLVLIEPETGTLQDRKDLRKLFEGLIGNALMKSQIEDLDNLW
jgi:hypothetical protein